MGIVRRDPVPCTFSPETERSTKKTFILRRSMFECGDWWCGSHHRSETNADWAITEEYYILSHSGETTVLPVIVRSWLLPTNIYNIQIPCKLHQTLLRILTISLHRRLPLHIFRTAEEPVYLHWICSVMAEWVFISLKLCWRYKAGLVPVITLLVIIRWHVSTNTKGRDHDRVSIGKCITVNPQSQSTKIFKYFRNILLSSWNRFHFIGILGECVLLKSGGPRKEYSFLQLFLLLCFCIDLFNQITAMQASILGLLMPGTSISNIKTSSCSQPILRITLTSHLLLP